jgi:hypothetical protein
MAVVVVVAVVEGTTALAVVVVAAAVLVDEAVPRGTAPAPSSVGVDAQPTARASTANRLARIGSP